jgi:hypothetical protein
MGAEPSIGDNVEITFEIIFFLIGISLALYFTVDFIVSLMRDRKSLIGKIWTWLKNVFDAISGIG